MSRISLLYHIFAVIIVAITVIVAAGRLKQQEVTVSTREGLLRMAQQYRQRGDVGASNYFAELAEQNRLREANGKLRSHWRRWVRDLKDDGNEQN